MNHSETVEKITEHVRYLLEATKGRKSKVTPASAAETYISFLDPKRDAAEIATIRERESKRSESTEPIMDFRKVAVSLARVLRNQGVDIKP